MFKNPVLMIGFVSIIYVMHFLFFHGGYFGYDDMEYCKLAGSLTQGHWVHDSQYAFRYGIVFPLAASYVIFGIHDFANFLTGFLPLILTFVWLWVMIKDQSLTYQWMAVMFLCLSPIHLMYVEKPMPDIVTELGFFTAFCAMYAERFKLPQLKFRWQFFMVGIVITILSKETILIFYPYFLAIAIYDILKGQHHRFWLYSAAGLLLFLLIYLLWSYWYFDDPLIRVKSIFAGQYLSPCAYDQLPASAVLKRIGYQLWLDLIRNAFLIPVIFLIILIRKGNDSIRFISISFISLLLLANFMTISYTSYVPLCPDPRHFIFILPIGTLLIAHSEQFIRKISKSDLFMILGLLMVQLCISIYHTMEHTWWLYLPLMGAILSAYFGYPRWMVVLWTAGLLSIYVNNATYHLKTDYKSQKSLNSYAIDSIPYKKYILTDHVNANIGSFHAGYDTSLTVFISFKAYDTLKLDNKIPKYIIINGMTNYLSNTNWELMPDFIRNTDTIFPKVFENKAGKVFKMDSTALKK